MLIYKNANRSALNENRSGNWCMLPCAAFPGQRLAKDGHPGCDLRSSDSHCKEPVEECAVALEGLAEVFGVYALTAGPLFFKLLALGCELLGDSLDDVGHEAVRL